MKNVSLSYKFLLTFLLHFPMQSQSDEGCASHEELIENSSDKLPISKPCDVIGLSYLTGLGIAPEDLSGLSDDSQISEHPYYVFFRRYIQTTKFERNPKQEEAFGFLLLGLAYLSPVDPLASNDDFRRNYYASYAISEYWKEFDGELGELPEIFEDALLEWLALGEFAKIREVRCFVENDSPTLSIERVIASPRYQTCLGGS